MALVPQRSANALANTSLQLSWDRKSCENKDISVELGVRWFERRALRRTIKDIGRSVLNWALMLKRLPCGFVLTFADVQSD